MRPIALLALVVLLGGCNRWHTPWLPIGTVSVTQGWKALGVPIDGGRVIRSEPDILVVRYGDPSMAERRRRAESWERALEANGWQTRERYDDLVVHKVRRRSYDLPDGGRAWLELGLEDDEVQVVVRRITKP